MNGGVDDTVFCVVDIETASIEEGTVARVCEIGAIQTRAEREIRRFTTLVHPQQPIRPEAQRIHGISDAMVASAPTFAQIAPTLQEMFRGTVLVAHNTAFDIPIINKELQVAGLPPLRNPATDTVRLARKSFAGLPSYGLDSLIDFFNLTVPNRHRSIGDCEATVHVLWRCVRRLQELGKVRTLIDIVELGKNKSLEPAK
jgi:DNA polymerase-3 subunit epsilon